MARKPTTSREPAGWEYQCTQPMLPPNATSPVMDHRQMEDWLNHMDDQGWEFVGYGATHWHNSTHPQQWWIFRRARQLP